MGHRKKKWPGGGGGEGERGVAQNLNRIMLSGPKTLISCVNDGNKNAPPPLPSDLPRRM